MYVKGTGPWCVSQEYVIVKDNYYARFLTHNYHRCYTLFLESQQSVFSLEYSIRNSLDSSVFILAFIANIGKYFFWIKIKI